MSRVDHRPDIEGLRALAVLAVLVHHAFPGLLPGGFSGVDIFFVVSGYVIGLGLLKSIAEGRFSFVGFWSRRVRRIFPALALVLLATWSAGLWLLTPAELTQLGRHMAAAALLANNVQLAGESGYFDAAAASKPLLHLWSLGVEEQFYLLVPCLLWLGVALRTGAVHWVLRLGVLSLVWLALFGPLHEAQTFYLLHTRLWELAAGLLLAHAQLRAGSVSPVPALSMPGRNECRWLWVALLAAALLRALSPSATVDAQAGAWALVALSLAGLGLADGSRGPVHERLRAFVGRHGTAIGLALLCASCVRVSPVAWPGSQTLWPVLGTLLVLAGTPAGPAAWLLSCRVATFVGRISYPLYLWHWPLLVYLGMWVAEPTVGQRSAALAAAVALAWLTERLLEQPMRFGRLGSRRFARPKARWAAAALVIAGLLGAATELGKGQFGRTPAGLAELASWSEPEAWGRYRSGECFHFLDNAAAYGPACTPPHREGAATLLLWGDSHAAHLYPGLAEWASAQGHVLAQWTTGSCPPTGLRLQLEGAACAARTDQALRGLRDYRPDTVVLAAAWGIYLEANPAERIVDAIEAAVQPLRASGVREIVLVGPGPRWAAPLPAHLYRLMLRQRGSSLPQRLDVVPARLADLDRRLAALAQRQGLQWVSVLDALCNAEGCRTIGDASAARPDLLFWDRDHLTHSGSRWVTAHARAVLEAAAKNRRPEPR